jgi:MFS family permease
MSSSFSTHINARFSGPAEHRNVFIAVFVDTVGTGLVLPLSLVYFTLPTNLPLVQIGTLSAPATLISLPTGLVGGAITDRFGAKPSMVSSNLLSAFAYLLFLTAHGPASVFLAIFVAATSDRMYWVSWPAYVHQLCAGRPFERWFSFLEAMKMGVMGVGAIASAIVLAVAVASGLKWLILANIITSVIAVGRSAHRRRPPGIRRYNTRDSRGERYGSPSLWSTTDTLCPSGSPPTTTLRRAL